MMLTTIRKQLAPTAVLLFLSVASSLRCVEGFIAVGGLQRQQRTIAPTASLLSSSTSTTSLYNILDDFGDMMGVHMNSNLSPQTSLPYSPPFCHELSCQEGVRTFAVQERLFSFTGEDFDVVDITNGKEDFCRVRGAMMHLPGKDKMRMYNSQSGEEVLVLDRKLVAATPTYDIYHRGNTEEKMGWIEKKIISMTDTFDVYMEGKGGFGVTGLFKPPPSYRIIGDFLDRTFVMKNDKDEVVARVSEDWVIEFDAFDHYQVQVAPGMDAMLVVSCLCAIDEEFDEEHKEAKKKKQEA